MITETTGVCSGGACTAVNRFSCPVDMVCSDPDITETDNYVCSCPTCVDSILSTSSSDQLTSELAFSRPQITPAQLLFQKRACRVED